MDILKDLEAALKRVETKLAGMFEHSDVDVRAHAQDLSKVVDAAKAHIDLHKVAADGPVGVVSTPPVAPVAPAVLPTLAVTPIPPAPVEPIVVASVESQSTALVPAVTEPPVA